MDKNIWDDWRRCLFVWLVLPSAIVLIVTALLAFTLGFDHLIVRMLPFVFVLVMVFFVLPIMGLGFLMRTLQVRLNSYTTTSAGAWARPWLLGFQWILLILSIFGGGRSSGGGRSGGGGASGGW